MGRGAVIGSAAGYALHSTRTPSSVFDFIAFSPATAAAGVVDCAFIIVAIISTARSTTRARLGIFLSYAVAMSVIFFAGLCWDEGTRENFTHPLTKRDARYVAIGTLSTSGTGSIAATSETTRAILTAQMTFDFALAAIAVSVIVTRFMAPRLT